MEKVKNLIYINGEYVPQEEIPPAQMKEISEKIMVTFAGALGYKKCQSEGK